MHAQDYLSGILKVPFEITHKYFTHILMWFLYDFEIQEPWELRAYIFSKRTSHKMKPY